MLEHHASTGRTWLRPLLFALVVYAAVLAVRLAELPKWDHAELRVDGEYIMATHDAYAWLAGAYGVGTGTGAPLARLARAYADLTGRPAGEFAFFAPACAASLVAVAVLLWAWTLGGPRAGLEAGLGAGFLAALGPGFYFRSRLGFYDTDMATLLFPLVQGWLVAHWLSPHLRRPLDLLRRRPDAEPEPAPASLAWPLATGLLVRLGGADWHQNLSDFNLVVAGLALALVLLLGRPASRSRLAWGLAILGLAGFFGNPGLALAVGLAAFFRFAPRLAARALERRWLAVLAAVLVLAAAGQGLAGKALEKYRVYAKPTVEAAMPGGREAAAGRQAPPVYPGITQSVVEAQNLDLGIVLQQVLPTAWETLAGIAGFLLVVVVRPTALFLAPLLGVALLGSVLGARMTMFGAPPAALGLLLPVAWALRRAAAGRAWGRWATALASAVLGFALCWPALREYSQVPPTPIITRSHALALKALAGIAPPGSRVWTWWDWGYATQYYARCMTFADGARHSGEYLYPLATALTTSSPLQASQVMAFSALRDYAPWAEWNWRTGPEVKGFMASLAANRLAERPRDRQYLVVNWENLRIIYWISYYGTWDVVSGQGVHGNSQEILGEFSVNPQQGVARVNGRQAPLASLDVLSPEGRKNTGYHVPQGPHLLVNRSSGQAFLLDDLAYRSAMVQLLIAPPDDTALQGTFRLVYDGFPMVRIYEAL